MNLLFINSLLILDFWWMMLDACLMVHGSRLMAHGQGRPGEARGSWPGSGPARLWIPRAGPAPGYEPWASPGLPWPWAMSLEPWAMNHQACIEGIEYWEIKKLMFLRFRKVRCREKNGDGSNNYVPPIPPTRIPFLLILDHFYVRFLDFPVFTFWSVFQFFGL